MEKRAAKSAEVLARLERLAEYSAMGETDCPQIFVLRPSSKLKVRCPRSWFSDQMTLSFLCPYDMQPVKLLDGSSGYVIAEPKSWIKKFGPALIASLFLISCALVTVRVTTGLPIPIPLLGLDAALDGRSIADKSLSSLRSMGDAACRIMRSKGSEEEEAAMGAAAAATCGYLAMARSKEELDRLPLDQREEISRVTGPAYRSLRIFLEEMDPGLAKLPMVKAVTWEGKIVWVSTANLAKFKADQAAKGGTRKHKSKHNRSNAALSSPSTSTSPSSPSTSVKKKSKLSAWLSTSVSRLRGKPRLPSPKTGAR